MALDMRVTGNRYDDLVLWGGVVTGNRRWARALGTLAHFGVGAGLAATYDALRGSLPRWGRPWTAIAFVQAENALLFPAVRLMDDFHPAVRRGALPSLWTWEYGAVEVARHAAYGIVLGLLEER
jgi:hypothetical protein